MRVRTSFVIMCLRKTLNCSPVESYKDHLSSNEELKHGVDWLTEVIRRYSDAIMTSRPLSTVNMSSPLRYEKWKKNETRYTDKEWSKEEKYAFEEGIFMHGAELRAVREEVGTRQMPEVVRYYGHWKKYVHLIQLDEILTLCIAPNWARRIVAFCVRASPPNLRASNTRT